MYWQRAAEQEFPGLLNFLEPIEPFCVNFTARLNDKTAFHRKNLIFIARAGYRIGRNQAAAADPLAAVMLSSGGLFIPAHPPDVFFTPGQVKKLLDRIYRSGRKIYCLIGENEVVGQYENVLKEKIDTRISYHLMKRESSLPIPLDTRPSWLDIRRLGPEDVPAVFRLEKAYQYEEVLVHPERFSPAAHMIHFRRQLENQTIFFAAVNGLPVAKAGTNAVGLHYSQIGGVFTDPEYRGRGIARSLMIELLHDIHTRGRGSVLYVKKGNEPAVRLYLHLGFEIIGEYAISYTRN